MELMSGVRNQLTELIFGLAIQDMDTAVAIRTLEATYKSSADAAAVETMILKLTEKVYYNC